MLGNTLIVIALAIVTTALLHLVMTRVLLVHRIPYQIETFATSPYRDHAPRCPVITPYEQPLSPCGLRDAYRDPHTQTGSVRTSLRHPRFSESMNTASAHTPTSYLRASPTNDVQSLEDELKQWMQRESTNWADSSVTVSDNNETPLYPQQPPPNTQPPISMATSLDAVFRNQEVDLKQVQPLPATITNDAPAAAMTPPTPPTVAYTNPMNSGNLGNGLSAFDGSDCPFASFS